jgi:SAM-dependent methyltransferase
MPGTRTRSISSLPSERYSEGQKMNVFDRYALFYDSCYATKDYEGESAFLLGLAHRYVGKDIRRILDMGCGTGSHAGPLARRGFEVVGFDISDAMVQQAREKIGAAEAQDVLKPVIRIGDIRAYRDRTLYDLCISMFAVMGYLTTNEDFVAGLKTARAHLATGGLFIFDVWYGPAVLTQRPERRSQEFQKGDSRILRLVTPELDIYRHVTKVHYRILEIRGNVVLTEMEETHEMRYFFAQELKLALSVAGFDLIAVRPFLENEREPTVDDWNVCVVAQAIEVVDGFHSVQAEG